MPSFNARSFYDPAVSPDTGEGLARGISAFGSAIAGGIQQRGENKRADAQRAESRTWQVSDRQAGWDHEAQTYQQRRGDAKADAAERRAMEEQGMRDQVAGKALAMTQAYGMDPRVVETLAGMDPDKANAFLDTYGGKHMAAYRNEMEIDQAIAKQKATDGYYQANPPQAGTVQFPNGGYVPTLNGKPMGGYYPPQQTEAQLSQDQLDQAIAAGATVSTTQGNTRITYGNGKPQATTRVPYANAAGEIRELPPGYSLPGWTPAQPTTPAPNGGPALRTAGSGIYQKR